MSGAVKWGRPRRLERDPRTVCLRDGSDKSHEVTTLLYLFCVGSKVAMDFD